MSSVGLGSDKLTKAGFSVVGLERPGDGLLNTISYLTGEICSLGARHFKHHSGLQV